MVSSMNMRGLYKGDFMKTDQIDVADLIWSPCGSLGLLFINTDVQLPKPGASGSTEAASLSVTGLERVELRWRRC